MRDLTTDTGPAYRLGTIQGATATMCFLVARYVQNKPLDEAIAETEAIEGGEGLGCIFRMIEPMMNSVVTREQPTAAP